MKSIAKNLRSSADFFITMNEYMSNLIQEYGIMAGISIDNIGNGQVRYRYREISETLGVWVSEKKAILLLKRAEKEVQKRSLRDLEDAFGPDELHNPVALGLPLS